MEFIIFIERFKHQFENINKIIKDYFYSKCIDKNLKIKLPILTKPSYILNQQLVSLFYLSNPNISNYDKLNLIYSNSASNINFEKMCLSLLNYPYKTIMLIKCLENFDESKYNMDNTSVFGIFCNTQWKSFPERCGDENSYIFSLIPRFRNFFPNHGEGGKSYFSLNIENNNNHPKGIGIGGEENQGFRIWLDEDLSKSFIKPEDKTFESGYILDSNDGKLNISLIEIWGLESDACYASVENMRQSEMSKAENMRKFDKSSMKKSNGKTKNNRELFNSLVKSKNLDCSEEEDQEEEENVVKRPNLPEIFDQKKSNNRYSNRNANVSSSLPHSNNIHNEKAELLSKSQKKF